MKPIILDVDTGIDDALAIKYALGSPELDVLGITTCFGNVPAVIASRNSLAILQMLGKDIPVYQGASKPLTRKPKYATLVHGEDGLGNALHFNPIRTVANETAVNYLIDQVRSRPNEITIIAVGPLTNLALAINLAPDIIPLIKEVIIMGGAVTVPGNVTPYGEANIVSDPEAADVVFNSGLPITLVGLDVTMKTLLPLTELDKWRVSEKYEVRLFTNMTEHYMKAYEMFYPGINGCALHDPLAVAVAIDSSFVTKESMNVKVVKEGIETGKTIGTLEKDPKINVCTKVDAERFLNHFLQTAF
ncbi:nucleoside hydrolase [Bacillus sp. JJ1566]|uniref:nucleoside hydrolase n=1 Tax=Bacillus sp. JJ1566 TaxID=3122961 RepID=UPI002FFDD4C4